MDKYISLARDFFERISSSYILNPTKKTITRAFCGVIALICAVSGIFVIREMTDKDPTTTAGETTDSLSVIVRTEEEMPLTANLLFALEGEDELELLGVMRLDSERKSVRVSFISGETYCSFNKLSGTMNEHYRQGGTTQLVWAVGEYAGISIERFILADYNSFKSMLNKIGDMTVILDHQVICGQDAASLIIEKGQQVLVPEMMTKYFGYLCSDTAQYGYEIAKTMMSYGEKLFCTGEEADIEKSFSLIMSNFSTNISAQDYVSFKNAIGTLACKEVLGGVAVAESPCELK